MTFATTASWSKSRRTPTTTPIWPLSSGPRLPVVLESEHYGPSDRSGAWGDGSLYLRAIEEYHASYASVHWYPREFLKANKELIDRINLRLGYRLQLLEASWPAEVSADFDDARGLSLAQRWGSAVPARRTPRRYAERPTAGGIAAVFADEEFDMRALPVGRPGKSRGDRAGVEER